jgi:hypothetical protein
MASLVIPKFPAIMAALTIIPPRDAAIFGCGEAYSAVAARHSHAPNVLLGFETQLITASFAGNYGTLCIDAAGPLILAYGPCSTTLAAPTRNWWN